MNHPQTFPEYSADVLESRLDELAAKSGYQVKFQVRFATLPVTCTLVEFAPDRTVTLHVPSQFRSPDGLNVYRNRWLGTWRLFAHVRRRYADATGCCPLWLGDAPEGPGLAFCGNGTSNVLIPDSVFLQSGGYAAQRMEFTRHWVPWVSREDKVFWRGASTGNWMTSRARQWHELPRLRLCLLTRDADPDLFDVGISNIVQITNAKERTEITAAGIVKGRVELRDFMKYRYSIDVDGNTSSWPGLFTKLLMGTTVLKIDSAAGYRQWYYDRLVPWKNFVPISRSMTELVEVAKWLKQNPRRALDIAVSGYDLAESLEIDSVLDQTADVVVNHLTRWPGVREMQLAAPPEEARLPATPAPVDTQASCPPEMHLTESGKPDVCELATKARAAFTHACHGDSDIDPGVLNMSGMSGRKYRMFINNLIRSLDDPSYLEVGTWTGSTLCSAVSRNRVRAVAIDNWSQFGGPKDTFLKNLQRFKPPEADVSFMESDFRKVDFASIG